MLLHTLNWINLYQEVTNSLVEARLDQGCMTATVVFDMYTCASFEYCDLYVRSRISTASQTILNSECLRGRDCDSGINFSNIIINALFA